MKNIKNSKGITLIALVVTIIVLLILAAVSITTLTGENGILTKANTAKNQTIEAEEKEQISLAYTTVMADKLHSNSGNDLIVTADELGKALENQNAGATVDDDGGKIKVTFTKSKNVYTVDGGTGEITGTGNGGGEDYNTATDVVGAITQNKPFKTETKITDTANKELTIPAGFKIATDSANTIAEGIIIEDYSGNQFVWVPVDNIQNFKRIEGYTNGNLEKMVVYCTEPFTRGYNEEEIEYNTMQKSVEDNHGFYIGRFEAGKDSSGNVVVKKGENVYNNVPWGNSMDDIEGTTNTDGKIGAVKLSKDFASINNYKNLSSTLCYGVQWDATMQFMDKDYLTSNCAENSYVRNSVGKGWYKDNYSSGNPEHKTGIDVDSNKSNCVKNIYDMAGNVAEWTMEAYSSDSRILRGGSSYYIYDDERSASSRYLISKTEIFSESMGFRITLYL